MLRSKAVFFYLLVANAIICFVYIVFSFKPLNYSKPSFRDSSQRILKQDLVGGGDKEKEDNVTGKENTANRFLKQDLVDKEKDDNVTGKENTANRPKFWTTEGDALPLCPKRSPLLVGKLQIDLEVVNFTEITARNPGLELGGHYHPPHCQSRQRAVVIVPYRDRRDHLPVLLNNLHSLLRRQQQLEYFIFVVELAYPTTFNKGLLMNIAALESLKLLDVDCFIFHDVDMIPENDLNVYICPNDTVRHLGVSVSKYGYKLFYHTYLGGATAFHKDFFFKVNGFSNLYFGWGSEDDDMFNRLTNHGVPFERYSETIGRYFMLPHLADPGNQENSQRGNIVRERSRLQEQMKDGLNSVHKTGYTVYRMEFYPTHTWLLVYFHQDTVLRAHNASYLYGRTSQTPTRDE